MTETIEPTHGAMWALAHPTRLRVWELLREGPSTASRLARRLGDSRGSASYHLRMLGRAGLIVEDETLGTRRERWWRRPEARVVGVARADTEGREIDKRMLAVFLARDEEIRHRFVVGRPSDEWLEASFIGNWFVPLTPPRRTSSGGSCSRSSTSCAAARHRPGRRRPWSR